MKHYSDMKAKYESRVQYIEVVKKARNAAQDELAEIRTELGIGTDDSIVDAIKTLKAENSEKNN